MNRDVWVIDAVRTPIGRINGRLASVRPDDLAAAALRAVVRRSGVAPEAIDDVYFGAANQSGEDNRNVARMAVLLARLPVEVPGVTLNRLCGSSLTAINSAAHAIAFGDADVMVAGGVESMTRAPYVLPKSDAPFGRKQHLYDTVFGWRMINPTMPSDWTISLGETAEQVAGLYGITRDEQDRFAYDSQMKCKAAVERDAFDDEIDTVCVRDDRGQETIVSADEHPRPGTTLEALAKLKPSFTADGTVTAGNSSGINDGAAALLLCEAERAKGLGLTPIARFVASASAGVAPDVMGLGPIPATRKALQRAGIAVSHLDVDGDQRGLRGAGRRLRARPSIRSRDARIVNGGAIALGHPLGASGARIATTLLHELRRRGGRYGLATMCIGVGQGIATIFERVE